MFSSLLGQSSSNFDSCRCSTWAKTPGHDTLLHFWGEIITWGNQGQVYEPNTPSFVWERGRDTDFSTISRRKDQFNKDINVFVLGQLWTPLYSRLLRSLLSQVLQCYVKVNYVNATNQHWVLLQSGLMTHCSQPLSGGCFNSFWLCEHLFRCSHSLCG